MKKLMTCLSMRKEQMSLSEECLRNVAIRDIFDLGEKQD